MTDSELIRSIRIVPDFPVKGIQFFDVTTLFKDPAAYAEVVDRICSLYRDKGITKVAGIESRGFINPKALYCNFIINITDVPRSAPIPDDVPVNSILNLSER